MDRVQKGKTEQRQNAKGKDGAFSSINSSQGLIIEPHVAIVISLLYVGIVIVLHMIGKYRRDTPISA